MKKEQCSTWSWGIGIVSLLVLALFLERQSKQVSLEAISNADFSNLYSDTMGSESVVFENGQYRKPTDLFPSLVIQMPFAKGDINGDFLADYAIIILHGDQRTFTGCDLVLVLNKNGEVFFTQGMLISLDSNLCDPTRLQIRLHQIIIEKDSFEYTKVSLKYYDRVLSNATSEK